MSDLREHDRFVLEAADFFDYLNHDVEAEDWAEETAGSELIWPDGRTESLPTTYHGWKILLARLPGEDESLPVIWLKEGR